MPARPDEKRIARGDAGAAVKVAENFDTLPGHLPASRTVTPKGVRACLRRIGGGCFRRDPG